MLQSRSRISNPPSHNTPMIQPYEPLHHKYRPQRLSELVGQEAIAATLANALRSGRIAPAYLFSGPRGTGKPRMCIGPNVMFIPITMNQKFQEPRRSLSNLPNTFGHQ